ncbi:MAG TPA: hypothetical protein VFA08_01365 [Actinomycetota bacterium]|jgi:hypothetical protein|nr:hypothetical protein [Actinomycetota bacterium]
MNLDGLGAGNVSPAVLILGAGATRGASFVAGRAGAPQPPLDADFFLQLERMSNRSADIRYLLERVAEEFGGFASRSMELVFSQLVASGDIAQLQRRPGRPLGTYKRMQDAFLVALVELFAEAIGDRSCDFHNAIVSTLRSGDSVISFNYDCLIDQTLATVHGVQSRFDPARSYGFAAALGAQYWGGPVRRRIRSPIQLLKPHGSLNWRVSSKGGVTTLALRADPYVGSAAERIIPPIAGKSIAAEPFATVWAAARDALARCRALVVVGYSAPDVDALSQALIRLHLATEVPRRLSALVVANPNQDVRNRWRSLCATAIRPARTRIFEYRTLDELAGAIS